MGFRFSKSIRLGKFIRLNISRAGVGGSIGIGPLRLGTGPRGTRLTADLPGAGTSYVKQWGGGDTPRRKSAKADGEAPQPAPTHEIPAPGFFSPGHEKQFVKALNALRRGDEEGALGHFLEAAAEEPSASISAAFLLSKREGGLDRAVALLEGVVRTEKQFPTELMMKYPDSARLPVRITPSVEATVPVGALAAALLLAELYQRQGRLDDSIGLLEELEELAGDPVLTLSLCELYASRGVWDGVIERARAVEPSDDLTLETRIFYGRAMQAKGLHEATVEVLTNALRKKKGRGPSLLREAAYWRAVSYQQLGKRAQANREFQKLYAEAPDFRDVAQRVAPS
jgi:tetratricopeptide (TPR) repeat protein